jgi:putative toxin-antitoxin system antitoxin component (TIGR02293 family)
VGIIEDEKRLNALQEEIQRRAEDVLHEQANAWLHAEIIALGNQAPAKLMETESAALIVLDTLGRIEYGVYS